MEVDKKRSRLFAAISMASTATLLFATPVIVLAFVGLFLDSKFHTTPVLLMLGIALGFIGGIFNVFRLLKTLKLF